jgi:phenylacetate-CoA ligase
MFQIRGENVYPSAIAEILEGLAGYGGEHRIIISRGGSMDELAVQAEFDQETASKGPDAVRALSERVEVEFSRVLGVRARVVMVEPDTFPRTDFKAQRVVDDRDLYHSLNQKRGG